MVVKTTLEWWQLCKASSSKKTKIYICHHVHHDICFKTKEYKIWKNGIAICLNKENIYIWIYLRFLHIIFAKIKILIRIWVQQGQIGNHLRYTYNICANQMCSACWKANAMHTWNAQQKKSQHNHKWSGGIYKAWL